MPKRALGNQLWIVWNIGKSYKSTGPISGVAVTENDFRHSAVGQGVQQGWIVG